VTRAVLAAGLALLLVAGCGGGSSGGGGDPSASTTPAGCGNGCSQAGPVGSPAPSSSATPEGCGPSCGQAGPVGTQDPTTPAGCGAYCQQAGGYGGGEAGETMMQVESASLVEVTGTLPVSVTCTAPSDCKGAVLISAGAPSFADVGRADLAVPSGATVTIRVPVSSAGEQAIRDAAGAGGLAVDVIADYGDPDCPSGSIRPCIAGKNLVIESAG